MASLIEHIDAFEWSDRGVKLQEQLRGYSAADEEGLVILATAALLIAQEHPGRTNIESEALTRLTREFADLVFRIRTDMTAVRRRTAMRVVGGTDTAGPSPIIAAK